MGMDVDWSPTHAMLGVFLMIMNCTLCSEELGNHYFMCDVTGGSYHPDCFDQTPCGKGEHGEGCPIHVMDLGDE